MKKPDITEGEWELLEAGNIENGELYLVNSEEELAIHDSFHRANAKAISAVPDMLDALLTAYEIIWELKNGQAKHLVADVELEEIKNALEKAGVEL